MDTATTPTIMIVDDEPLARDIIEGFLSREKYRLYFASNGKEALANIDEANPDLVLLDVMMPEMDGFEVCQRLKAQKQWQHVPIILITALDSKEELAQGLDAGADDFLNKPVNDIELRARVRSMLRIKRQYDQLKATLHLREDMTNMIVHDIRTPLTAIMGYCGLLMIHSTCSPQDRNKIEDIQAQARRLNSMLNDMLIMAKMESQHLLLNRKLVNLNAFVQRVKTNFEALAQLSDINLVVDLPAQAQPALLDADLFERVLDNLISNAIKISPPKSTVTIRVEYPDDGILNLRLKILDEGAGIAPEDRERIFNKFETVASNQRGALQVGLGLAFCNLVVEAHGGRIFVESNEPAGSSFVVEI